MRIVCLAYSLIGHMGLEHFLSRQEDEVVGVFTHEDAPGEEIWFPSVARLAAEHGVQTFTPENINEPRWVQLLGELQPDFVFSFWYRRLVKRPILEIPPGGCYNLHGSLLPKYRGRAPVNWALVNGETQTGITLHAMTPGADAGDIIGQAVVPIDLQMTAMQLYDVLAEAGREVLAKAWPLLRANKAVRTPQDERQATCVGGRGPDDGRFDWSWPALRIHNLVRAVTHPYPGAFTDSRPRILHLWATRPAHGLTGSLAAGPGTVLDVGDDGLLVATGAGNLVITRLQFDGEEELASAPFARRYGISVGSRL